MGNDHACILSVRVLCERNKRNVAAEATKPAGAGPASPPGYATHMHDTCHTPPHCTPTTTSVRTVRQARPGRAGPGQEKRPEACHTTHHGAPPPHGRLQPMAKTRSTMYVASDFLQTSYYGSPLSLCPLRVCQPLIFRLFCCSEFLEVRVLLKDHLEDPVDVRHVPTRMCRMCPH